MDNWFSSVNVSFFYHKNLPNWLREGRIVLFMYWCVGWNGGGGGGGGRLVIVLDTIALKWESNMNQFGIMYTSWMTPKFILLKVLDLLKRN